MPRVAPEIKLSDADRVHLEKLSRSHSAERRMVERAAIVLACAEGQQNQQIAQELSMSVVRVGKWRSRFALYGLPGLSDEQRPGKPVIHGEVFRNTLLAQLEQLPPEGLARWDWLTRWASARQRYGGRCGKKVSICIEREVGASAPILNLPKRLRTLSGFT
jgi:transposase